jgi:hypothetical protein
MARHTTNHAIEFAWRVHAAQGSWAGNADVKASILLALEGGVLYAAVSGGNLARSTNTERHIASVFGIAMLLAAIAASALVIFPRLGRRNRNPVRQQQVVYFGDLRHWDGPDLCAHIAKLSDDEQLKVLSQQLTQMSRLNWAKHRWVQVSLLLALTGMVVTVLSAVTTL